MAYDVTIEAIVRKTIRIEEDVSQEAAVELAHERFTVVHDEEAEDYDEQMLKVEKV